MTELFVVPGVVDIDIPERKEQATSLHFSPENLAWYARILIYSSGSLPLARIPKSVRPGVDR